MTTDEPADVEPKDFEQALQQLEAIVTELEQGELTLESSLARYEQGVRLARFCSRKLEQAEKRIEVLRTDDSGEPKLDAAGAPMTGSLEIPD